MAGVVRLFPDPDQPRGDVPGQKLAEAVRIAEALLFASTEPMPEVDIGRRLPEGLDVSMVLAQLKQDYEARGIHLVRVGGKWLFRTADDLGWLLSASGREVRRLSRAAMETLAIIAYHQPTTRAEIEDIRGVAVAKGTLDVLLETGWIRPRGRRRTPGRPITYGTTDGFLLHFGLEAITDLPGLDELRGAGLFDGLAPSFTLPLSRDGLLGLEEDPLDDPLDHDAADDAPPDDEDRADDDGGMMEPQDDEEDTLDRDPFA